MCDYASRSCPNQECSLFGKKNQGNIAHRSWMGKERKIERLRCKECKEEFSERRGTLMQHSHLKEDTVEILLKCQRWGVCDEGIADIAKVDIKTVYLFQKKQGERAFEHHHCNVREVEDEAVQLDEAHTKIHGEGGYWIAPAICLTSLLILFVEFGRRNQELADGLIRETVLRLKKLLLVLTDGWMPYASALLKYLGRRILPNKTGKRGRPKMAYWQTPKDTKYAQVVKKRNKRGRVTEVICRAVFGGIAACIESIVGYGARAINTIHIERWFGTLRSCIAACRRRTRCGSKKIKHHKYKVWSFISLYNWVIPHSSLSDKGGKGRKTPAMAAGLIDHVMTYKEYIWMPVHVNLKEKADWQAKANIMDSQANRKTKRFNFAQQYEILKEAVA
jgi:IS1 family transposase/transposase-like protein